MTAIYGFDDVGNHANMLLDTSRVDAFARAIDEVVRPGDVVADLGAGSGILSILAAKAGASRVYAIERGPLASLIASEARANSVGDVITVLRTDAREAVFDEAPTVIVSETLGNFAIDEDILGLLKTVCARAPLCRVIPSSAEVHLALANIQALDVELCTLTEKIPVRLPTLRAHLTSRVAVGHVTSSDLIASGAATHLTIGKDSAPTVLRAEVQVSGSKRANAVVAWFRARLGPTTWLASGPDAPCPSWGNLIFPLDPPLEIAAGDFVVLEVRPRLVTDRGTWAWSATRGSDVRRGDAMKSLAGGTKDMLAQLGLTMATTVRDTKALARWAAALDGTVDEPRRMSDRLRAAFPSRYADDADAEQEVLRMIVAAERAS